MSQSKKIYIVMTFTGTLFSRLIRKFTKVYYPHASISLNQDFLKMYSFGRKIPLLPIFGGFVIENPHKGVYRVFKNTDCTVYELEVSFEQYRKLEKSIKKFEENAGDYKYNLIGLVTLLFNYSFKRDKYFFCTQFVDSVLKEAGINVTNKASEFVKPNDFLNNDNLKIIYSGKIRDMTDVMKDKLKILSKQAVRISYTK